MTQDDIIDMAKEAGFETALMKGQILTNFPYANATKEIERLVELVRADEREACAKIFEDHWRETWTDEQVVEAIRARGQA